MDAAWSHTVRLGNRVVGGGAPTYVIAEVGVNHNGDVAVAHDLVDAAKATGADAVKFQAFDADALALASAEQAAYQKRTAAADNQLEMLRALELSETAFSELRGHCDDVGLDFIATAFDTGSLDLVLGLDPVCLKWPSGELTNWPLLRQAAASKLPVLLSTGMASMTEIEGALSQLAGGGDVVLLQCVSEYPARIEDQNLRAIATLAETFGVPCGFSDHTLGYQAALVARAFGMCVLEKHITLDTTMPGPDHGASMEPGDFTEMVRMLRAVESGIGTGVKEPTPGELETKAVARKSLVFAADLPDGHTLTIADLTAKRPASGMSPDQVDRVLGRQLATAVRADQLVSDDLLR